MHHHSLQGHFDTSNEWQGVFSFGAADWPRHSYFSSSMPLYEQGYSYAYPLGKNLGAGSWKRIMRFMAVVITMEHSSRTRSYSMRMYILFPFDWFFLIRIFSISSIFHRRDLSSFGNRRLDNWRIEQMRTRLNIYEASNSLACCKETKIQFSLLGKIHTVMVKNFNLPERCVSKFPLSLVCEKVWPLIVGLPLSYHVGHRGTYLGDPIILTW